MEGGRWKQERRDRPAPPVRRASNGRQMDCDAAGAMRQYATPRNRFWSFIFRGKRRAWPLAINCHVYLRRCAIMRYFAPWMLVHASGGGRVDGSCLGRDDPPSSCGTAAFGWVRAKLEMECPTEEDTRLTAEHSRGRLCHIRRTRRWGLSGDFPERAALDATVPRGGGRKGRFGCKNGVLDATQVRLSIRGIGGSRTVGARRCNCNMSRGGRLGNYDMESDATHAAL
jgi:hypothetical protein